MIDDNRTAFAQDTETQEATHQETPHQKAASHREGKVAKCIENQTAKLPSDLFLWSAGACIVGSLALQLSGKEHASLFVGQWVAPTLILGLYNKLVKIAGSDQIDREGDRAHMM